MALTDFLCKDNILNILQNIFYSVPHSDLKQHEGE